MNPVKRNKWLIVAILALLFITFVVPASLYLLAKIFYDDVREFVSALPLVILMVSVRPCFTWPLAPTKSERVLGPSCFSLGFQNSTESSSKLWTASDVRNSAVSDVPLFVFQIDLWNPRWCCRQFRLNADGIDESNHCPLPESTAKPRRRYVLGLSKEYLLSF